MEYIMKKILILGLYGIIGCMATAQQTINLQITNNLAYGAITDRGGWKMLNLCTVGSGECKLGPISLGGVQVTPVPVNIRVCTTQNNQFGCQSEYIRSGETKMLQGIQIGGPMVYVWAQYNDGYHAKFEADTRKSGNLEFPKDFGQVKEYKKVEAVMR